VNGPFRAEEQEHRHVTQAFRPGLAEPAFQAGGEFLAAFSRLDNERYVWDETNVETPRC
jgi:hypothetical protein